MNPSAGNAFDLPDRVGRYVLGPAIGAGAFAVVVRAADEGLDAEVALKILTPRHARDPEIRERFIREGRMLRRVRNPSVVTVHDVGETPDGRPFLVMELARGGVLADRLEPARCPPDAASFRHVVRALAEGLGSLHAAGVIHRDVKPANLLVLRDRAAEPRDAANALLAPGERVVVADLGLAKDQLATAYGPTMVGGTFGFLAPEQAELGASIDARADIYSATGVVWQLLTGRQPPFFAELAGALPELPLPWRPVLARGLATAPGDRFQTMDEWAEAVLARVDQEAVTSPPVITPRVTSPEAASAGGPRPAHELPMALGTAPARVEVHTPRGVEVLPLTGGTVSIGRAATNDVALPEDNQVSRLHAALERLAGGWCVRDLGSRNGTFLNGERLTDARALRHGDEVRVGGSRLTYRQDAAGWELTYTATSAADRAPALAPAEKALLVRLVAAAGATSPPPSAPGLAAAFAGHEDALRGLTAKFGLGPDALSALADEAVRRGAVTPADLRRTGP
jgi:tRNA A-37 threonylcarbamoyl transferase component Bud32